MNIELTDQVDCLCDFTFDFYWQHKGSRLSPDAVIPHQKDTSHTYSDLVKCLKRGEDVHIKGDAGKRLGSSLGVDLMFFGGSGGSLKVGSIMVDGNVDTRMGISTVSGSFYVGGNARQPLGNVIEVESDRAGYHKFVSITGLLEKDMKENILSPNALEGDTLFIRDGVIRDTIAARLDADKKVVVDGNAGMSTGILMNLGSVHVDGDAGMNTGVLMRGGIVLVNNSGEFAGSYMKGGTIFYKGDAMQRSVPLEGSDIRMLIRFLGTGQIEAMMFRKYSR
ncbi:MAG TPA: formylmethanofuran dehydrogenase [Candidatus Methanoperedens sp.]|nr:formylmethanofuran dehydrogenase [Candidatus Methanoperedens sp.]HLB70730.1 formylmethanofuran dehydrogenase [Candidatus Methanoperedens sp.]